MKLSYPSLGRFQIGISSADAYYEKLAELDQIRSGWKSRLANGDKEWRAVYDEELRLRFEFQAQLLPQVLISQCPYCSRQIWQRLGIFSLRDDFWYYESSNGRDVYKESLCPHLFCVDGALNLNGIEPTEAIGGTYIRKKISMASEVPFVKPRVLNLPTMIAVMHRVPIAEKYSAFPMVYFCKQKPAQNDFCIPWAREEFVDHDYVVGEGTFSGTRSDKQDYDLIPWVKKAKLRWIEPNFESDLSFSPDFPYQNLAGRRHPYRIENGKVYDLPDPIQAEPKVEWER